DDRQAQAGAAKFAGKIVAAEDRFSLAEFFEDDFFFRFGDADAGVGDPEFDLAASVAPRADGNASALGRELDGVGKQVRKNLLDLRLVLIEQREAAVDLGAKIDVLFFGHFADQVALVGDDL